jgi:hypothetical protein
METKTSICNKALAHLAITTQLTDVDTDTTVEAKVCRLFYENARDECLRDFPWPWATRVELLANQTTEPNDEWAYQYDYPTNVSRLVRIFSGVRPESRSTRIPFRVVTDGTFRYLWTSMDAASIEYVEKVTSPSRYPADFVQAMTLKLAAYIAPALTGGDPAKLGIRALQLYEYQMGRALTNAANESQVEVDPESDFILARE